MPPTKDQRNEWMRRYRKKYPEKTKAADAKARAKVKAEALSEYGGTCYCCGESESRFLSLDHVDGGGAEHRRSVCRSNFYSKLRALGWPKFPKLRVACYNCNLGRRLNAGVCPHNEVEENFSGILPSSRYSGEKLIGSF